MLHKNNDNNVYPQLIVGAVLTIPNLLTIHLMRPIISNTSHMFEFHVFCCQRNIKKIAFNFSVTLGCHGNASVTDKVTAESEFHKAKRRLQVRCRFLITTKRSIRESFFILLSNRMHRKLSCFLLIMYFRGIY